MNERIKEIIDRCGLYLAPDNPEVLEKELEFFAEEIVREWMDVANSHFESKEPGYPGDKILEHFGVE